MSSMRHSDASPCSPRSASALTASAATPLSASLSAWNSTAFLIIGS